MSDETEQTEQDHSYAEEPAGSDELHVDDELDEIVESLTEDAPLPAQLADEVDATEEPESDAELAADAAAEADAEVAAQEPEEAAAEEPVEPDAAADTDESQDAADEPDDTEAESATAAVESPADAVVIPKPRSLVPRWPFWTLAGAWIAVCGGAAYLLTRDPAMPSLRQDVYTFVVAAGLVLTILGPITALVVWAFARSGAAEERRPGMFATSLMRAALVTFFGVVAWTGVLILVDALRLGLIRF